MARDEILRADPDEEDRAVEGGPGGSRVSGMDAPAGASKGRHGARLHADGGATDGGSADGGSTDGGAVDGGTPDDGGLVDGSDPLALSLRPRSLEEFVGQSELKRRLSVILEAARRRSQPPDHFLFAGPPGLGKTSLSGIVASEMGVTLHVTSGPALERPGDLAAILTKLGNGDVLFIDEIHRLSRSVEEVLYPAMEDFQLDIVLGKGPAARSIRLDLPQFCLVGATTRTGLITGPLRDRFGLVARLDFYEPEDLASIVLRAAHIMGARITPDGAMEIAHRSRGTPRIANRLLRRVRDVADVEGDGTIDGSAAREGLAIFGIDNLGLDKVDRAILSALCERFGGGPLGLSTLAIAVSEPTETVEDVYEPFLIQQGLLARTPRGRVATPAAWAHLGLSEPIDTTASNVTGRPYFKDSQPEDQSLFD